MMQILALTIEKSATHVQSQRDGRLEERDADGVRAGLENITGPGGGVLQAEVASVLLGQQEHGDDDGESTDVGGQHGQHAENVVDGNASGVALGVEERAKEAEGTRDDDEDDGSPHEVLGPVLRGAVTANDLHGAEPGSHEEDGDHRDELQRGLGAVEHHDERVIHGGRADTHDLSLGAEELLEGGGEPDTAVDGEEHVGHDQSRGKGSGHRDVTATRSLDDKSGHDNGDQTNVDGEDAHVANDGEDGSQDSVVHLESDIAINDSAAGTGAEDERASNGGNHTGDHTDGGEVHHVLGPRLGTVETHAEGAHADGEDEDTDHRGKLHGVDTDGEDLLILGQEGLTRASIVVGTGDEGADDLEGIPQAEGDEVRAREDHGALDRRGDRGSLTLPQTDRGLHVDDLVDDDEGEDVHGQGNQGTDGLDGTDQTLAIGSDTGEGGTAERILAGDQRGQKREATLGQETAGGNKHGGLREQGSGGHRDPG